MTWVGLNVSSRFAALIFHAPLRILLNHSFFIAIDNNLAEYGLAA